MTESREYYENVRLQNAKHLEAFERELEEMSARKAEIERQSDWLRDQSAQALHALQQLGPRGGVYCVECGAETELDCICDEMNGPSEGVSIGNEI